MPKCGSGSSSPRAISSMFQVLTAFFLRYGFSLSLSLALSLSLSLCVCFASYYVLALDGAFFGTSFAHLFFITFDRLVPDPARATYTPLIFGFKIHK